MSKNRIICIANNKGGCGKTLVASHLAAALSLKGAKTLLIDNDPQGDSTAALLPRHTPIERSLYDIIDPDTKDKPLLIDCVYPSIHKNLWVLPNITETAFLDIKFAQNFPKSNLYMRNALRDDVLSKYEYTIIDCPPTLSTFVNNALCCSDFLLIPTVCGSANSLKGVKALLTLNMSLPEQVRPDFLKILLNKMDMRKTVHKNVLMDLIDRYGKESMFETIIPTSTLFEQTEYLKACTIFRHKASSKGATAFRALAVELMSFFEAV